MTQIDIKGISADVEQQLKGSLATAAEQGKDITPEFAEELFELTVQMALIQEKVSLPDVLPLLDQEGIIHRALMPFNVFLPEDWVLTDDDHTPWLDSRRADIDWTHWLAYKQSLLNSIPYNSVLALDRVTDEVLGLLGDPEGERLWDRRGLVMGNVQSGKTANYVGLINKAICSGYKVIIILAGLHNNLRSQTQQRVDENIIGKDSRNGLQGNVRKIGVGNLKNLQQYGVAAFTSADEHGDFNTQVANQLQIPLHDAAPKIFVIKKNVKPLKNLREWLREAASISENQRIEGIPLLVIDDEADQASINTGLEPEPDDDEIEPSAINAGIRKILNDFDRSSYVGYTATPFANIFQATLEDPHQDFGDDLFPRSFIKTLSPPSNYFGPSQIFGTDSREGQPAREGLPLVKEVTDDFDNPDDLELWIPRKHDINHNPEEHLFPESLEEAMQSFILTCAARLVRQPDSKHHNSMLIHLSRYIDVQIAITEQVENKLYEIRDGLDNEHPEDSNTLQDFKRLWERDFVPITKALAKQGVVEVDDAWYSFPSQTLNDAVKRISVKQISGKSKDTLEYDLVNGVGRSFIAVGGDKLSRGLTLEGLSMSYYSRASRMYDTLMQMGRWFGYRNGYLDLCRLYTTTEIRLWYRHIATASEELMDTFVEMVSEDATPKDYGLRVRAHPEMMVTNRLKWKKAEMVKVSFSAIRPETTVFKRNAIERENNFKLLRGFIENISQDTTTRISNGSGGNKIMSSVSADRIMDYLSSLNNAGSYSDMRYPLDAVINYIEKMVEAGGLTDWNVLLVSNSQAPNQRRKKVGEYSIGVSKRNDLDGLSETYVIKSLIDPQDESVGLNKQQQEQALVKAHERNSKRSDPKEHKKVKAYGKEYRAVRPHTSGLLILYLLDDFENKEYGDQRALDPAVAPFVGLCLSFPQAPPGVPAVDYVLNPVALDQR